MPLFSVVIPTRNRAHLLINAVRSAIGQSFDDFELVVSNNNSSDSTEDVARSFDRVRYVKTERTLSMPDHWEFAFDQARGKFVTFLCDDDALHPNALEEAARAIASGFRIAVWGTAIYYAPDWSELDKRNSCLVLANSGESKEIPAGESFALLATCGNTYRLPRMLNSVVDRELANAVRQKAGRLFILTPDYSFPALTLPQVKSWCLLDRPLRLQGVFPEGIGAAHLIDRNKAVDTFHEEIGDEARIVCAPMNTRLVTNLICETLMRAKRLLPDELSPFQIDWPGYFFNCWQDIRVLESNGVDVAGDKAEFFKALEKQDPQLVAEVRNRISPTATTTVSLLRRLAGRGKRLVKLVSEQNNGTQSASSASNCQTDFMLTGEFRDIFECSLQLPRS